MVLTTWSQRLATLTLLVFALGIGFGAGVGISAPNDPIMVFGSDVLTFVTPDKTADFERVIDRFHAVLEESDDPIRRQQSANWRIFRSPDPGPGGAALYVSFMEPVLRGANYSMADIMAEELPEDEAEELVSLLEGALSQSQSVLSLESIIHLADALPPEPTETEETDTAL